MRRTTRVLPIVALIVTMGVYGCQTGRELCGRRDGPKAAAETLREQMDAALSLGAGQEVLKASLFDDQFLVEALGEGDPTELEMAAWILRRHALIHAARFHAYDEILACYYYGDEESGARLSDLEQIGRAAWRYVMLGPLGEAGANRVTHVDGSETTLSGDPYEIGHPTIVGREAQIECSVRGYGVFPITLHKRYMPSGLQLWIPVEVGLGAVY